MSDVVGYTLQRTTPGGRRICMVRIFELPDDAKRERYGAYADARVVALVVDETRSERDWHEL